MPLSPPPTQDDAISPLNRFMQTWVLWFQTLYKDVTEKKTGWAYYQDSQYTQASPLSITSGRTQITNNTLGPVTDTNNLPTSVTSWFYGNKFTPNAINDAFILRLDFTATAGSPADKFNLELEVGSGDIIFSPTLEMNKGSGTRHYFSVSIPVWVGSNFLANGGKFYINTTSSFTIDTVGLYINRTHKA